MKNLPFRTSLFLTTFLTTGLLLVAGCDQNAQTKNQNAGQDDIAGFFSGYANDTPPQTLSGDFLSGQFAQNHSDWDNASVYFSRILEVSPRDPDVQKRVLALDIGAGHYDRAVDTARTMIDQGQSDVTLAHLVMSLSLFKDGKYDASLKEITYLKDDNLGAAILPLLKLWADAGQGRSSPVAGAASPSLAYQYVLLAAYKNDKAALADLAKTTDFTKTPTTIPRLEQVAKIFARYGERAEAKQIFDALAAAIPEKATYYADLVKATESGDSAKWKEPQLTPQAALSDAMADVAEILSARYADSSRLFAQLSLFLNSDNVSALDLLAQIAASNHLYTEAITYLSRIDTDGDADKKSKIIQSIAQMQVAAGQPDEAIRLLKDLVNDQKNIDAQIQIGEIYRNQDKFADALSAYNAAYAMIGNKITAPYWELSFARGMTNERLKNWEDAEKDLKTALSFQPDQPYILNYLGYSWADQGTNLDKAADMIEKAARLKPDDGAIIDSLGWIYFRMGKFDKAVATLEKAIELAPTEPEINDHLGDAYWRVGRKSEARFQWSRAASFSKDEKFIQKITQKQETGLPDSPSTTTSVENNRK